MKNRAGFFKIRDQNKNQYLSGTAEVSPRRTETTKAKKRDKKSVTLNPLKDVGRRYLHSQGGPKNFNTEEMGSSMHSTI